MALFPDAPLTALPLAPISPRLPVGRPFTPAMAARAGVGRAVIDRLLREGRVRRLVRGVYLDATVASSIAIRAEALGLVVGPRQVVIGRTAAWLHGVALETPATLVPVEVHGRGRAARQYAARPVRYSGRDLELVGSVQVTTPLRTALDLGRHLAPDRAIAALDGLLGLGTFSHTALTAELPRFTGQAGIGQLRELAALADARAECPAESVLRLRWLAGRLPTPSPGWAVRAGSTRVRLALGLESHRFGAALGGRLSAADLVALTGHGWHVVVVDSSRVLHSAPEFVVAHLEREFHRHLLEQVG